MTSSEVNFSKSESGKDSLINIIGDVLWIQWGEVAVQLHKDGQICFKNHRAAIRLSGEGELVLTGKNITQQAEEDLRLVGERNIHLN